MAESTPFADYIPKTCCDAVNSSRAYLAAAAMNAICQCPAIDTSTVPTCSVFGSHGGYSCPTSTSILTKIMGPSVAALKKIFAASKDEKCTNGEECCVGSAVAVAVAGNAAINAILCVCEGGSHLNPPTTEQQEQINQIIRQLLDSLYFIVSNLGCCDKKKHHKPCKPCDTPDSCETTPDSCGRHKYWEED